MFAVLHGLPGVMRRAAGRREACVPARSLDAVALGAPFAVDGQRTKSDGIKSRSLLPEPSLFGSPPMISEYGCPDCAVKKAPKLCVRVPLVTLYVADRLMRCLTWYDEVESSGLKISPRLMKPNCHCELA